MKVNLGKNVINFENNAKILQLELKVSNQAKPNHLRAIFKSLKFIAKVEALKLLRGTLIKIFKLNVFVKGITIIILCKAIESRFYSQENVGAWNIVVLFVATQRGLSSEIRRGLASSHVMLVAKCHLSELHQNDRKHRTI